MRLLWRGSVSGRIAAPDGWFLSCGWSGYVLLVPVICLLLKLNRGLFLLVKPSHQQSYISDSQSHKVDYALCTLINRKRDWKSHIIPTGQQTKTHIIEGGGCEGSPGWAQAPTGAEYVKPLVRVVKAPCKAPRAVEHHALRVPCLQKPTNRRHRKRGGTVNRYRPVLNAASRCNIQQCDMKR